VANTESRNEHDHACKINFRGITEVFSPKNPTGALPRKKHRALMGWMDSEGLVKAIRTRGIKKKRDKDKRERNRRSLRENFEESRKQREAATFEGIQLCKKSPRVRNS